TRRGVFERWCTSGPPRVKANCKGREWRVTSGESREGGEMRNGRQQKTGAAVLRPYKYEAKVGLAAGGDGRLDRREPVVDVGFVDAGDGEEFFLESAGDGAGDAFADLNVIDRADRRDFDGGADEEHFVDDVEHFTRDDGFLDWNLQVLGKGDDR